MLARSEGRNFSGGLHGATLQGLGGAQRSGEKVSNVSVGIARWAGTFEHLPLYSDEESAAVGIIGQNLLDKFDVLIDFGSMQLELSRP